MKQFTYSVNDPLGIHARPAGMLAKLVKGFADTTVVVEKDGKEAKASQLMKLMSLAIKQGDTVTVKVDGAAEEEAFAAVEKFFQENL